jgi:signal transduction protein with GAF and PtsI domain
MEAAPEFVASSVLQEHGIVSLANVPILIDGMARGVLEVDSSVKRDFSEDTVEFLMAAAALIGSTVRRNDTEQAKTEAAAVALAQVQAREVLLREMQHRVKNNFQIILASIAIQKRRFTSDEVQRASTMLPIASTQYRLHMISSHQDRTCMPSMWQIICARSVPRFSSRLTGLRSMWRRMRSTSASTARFRSG